MENQSNIIKALQTGLDELELLVIEGENLDMDVMVGLVERFEKLKKIIEEKRKLRE